MIGCRNLRTAYNGHPAETIVVLKVARLLLLRISLKPSSYGKVDEAIVTSLIKKKSSASLLSASSPVHVMVPKIKSLNLMKCP